METRQTKHRRVTRSTGRGFTLIELLVVIAIISLLVSILLPSLTKAKLIAQAAVCGSNLKQAGTMLHLYASDYDERLPRFLHDSNSGTWTVGDEWHRVYWPYVTTAWVGRFQDDIADVTLIFDCPTTTTKVWQCGYNEVNDTDPYTPKCGVLPKRFDYGVWSPVGHKYNVDYKLSDFPPDQEIVAEAHQGNGWYTWGAFGSKGFNQCRVSSVWSGRWGGNYDLGDHHFGAINTLYIDGSVARVDYRTEP